MGARWPVAERVLLVWTLSEAQYRRRGEFPDESGLPRSVALLRASIAHEVRFLIVGAYALGVLGRPRATGDLANKQRDASAVWPDRSSTAVFRAGYGDTRSRPTP